MGRERPDPDHPRLFDVRLGHATPTPSREVTGTPILARSSTGGAVGHCSAETSKRLAINNGELKPVGAKHSRRDIRVLPEATSQAI
jgi:hypothetical protein